MEHENWCNKIPYTCNCIVSSYAERIKYLTGALEKAVDSIYNEYGTEESVAYYKSVLASQKPETKEELMDFQEEKLKIALDALEEMCSILKGRHFEHHSTLTSNPVQNGCLVYTDWKLDAIKKKALDRINELTK